MDLYSNVEKKTLLSILIPTWERCDTIEKILYSSGVVGHPEVEFIIVDNASSQHTKECLWQIVTDKENVRLFINSENIGMVKNWNKSISKSSGEWLMLMCSDDIFVEGRVKEILELLKTKIDTPSLILQDESLNSPIIKLPAGKDTINKINLPIASGNIWHRSITDRVGGFDVRLEYSPDAEFWYRIAKDYPVFLLNRNIAKYQRNDTSYMWKTWGKDDFIDQIRLIISCKARYYHPNITDNELVTIIDKEVWKTYLQILGDTIATKRHYLFKKYIIIALREYRSIDELFELVILLSRKVLINTIKTITKKGA